MCTKSEVPKSTVKVTESGTLATANDFSILLGCTYLYSPATPPEKLFVIPTVLIWVPEPVVGDTRQFLKDSPMIDTLGLTLKGNTSLYSPFATLITSLAIDLTSAVNVVAPPISDPSILNLSPTLWWAVPLVTDTTGEAPVVSTLK